MNIDEKDYPKELWVYADESASFDYRIRPYQIIVGAVKYIRAPDEEQGWKEQVPIKSGGKDG